MLLKNIEFLMFITIWLPIESASLLKGSEYWKKDFINKAERAQSLCQATCVSPMICRNGECVLAQSGTRERNQDNDQFTECLKRLKFSFGSLKTCAKSTIFKQESPQENNESSIGDEDDLS